MTCTPVFRNRMEGKTFREKSAGESANFNFVTQGNFIKVGSENFGGGVEKLYNSEKVTNSIWSKVFNMHGEIY